MIQATPRMKFDWSHLMVEGVLFLLLTGMDEIEFFARVKFYNYELFVLQTIILHSVNSYNNEKQERRGKLWK